MKNDLKEKHDKIIKSGDIVVVCVSYPNSWCLPCASAFEWMSEVKKQFGDDVNIYNIDGEKNQEICEILNLFVIPTAIIYYKGVLVEKLNGINNITPVIDYLNFYIKKLNSD